MYTIGEVSLMFHLPVSTLRYYDKEGLFPNLERTSGIRRFSDREIDALHVIECLKKSGLEIKEIKQFMIWCEEGPSTYEKRKELFETRKKVMEEQILEMENSLALIRYKCWFYDCLESGKSREEIQAMIPDRLPENIRKDYLKAYLNKKA